MSGAPPFQYPHDIDAVIDSLDLDLDPKLRRRLSDAIAMLIENNDAVAQAVGGGAGNAPVFDADPTSPDEGQFWCNSVDVQFRVRLGGVTHDLI